MVGAVVAGLAESVKSRAITDALIIRGTPTHTLSPEAFKAHVESYEAPWLVRYLAIRGYSHADLGKFVLPVYDVLKDSDVVIQEREPDAVGDELIEGVPAATFDIFTSEGKRVASYLSKCPPFRSYAPAQISMAMFHAEGAYLNRSVASVELAALDLEAKLIDWRSVGIGNSTHVVELMRVFREQRALINHARRRIMG